MKWKENVEIIFINLFIIFDIDFMVEYFVLVVVLDVWVYVSYFFMVFL